MGSSILLFLFLIEKGNHVLLSPSPQRCRSKLGGPGNKLMHVLRCALFIVWRPKKYGPLTSLTNSNVSAKTTLWSCNRDSLANFAVPMDFYIYFAARTPETTCEFIPIEWVYGSVTLDRSSRAAYHMLAEGVCTALHMNAATGRSRAADHMLAEGVCTAS